jgi:hypothetical protein
VEAERPGDEKCRERLLARVEPQHRRVVVAARGGDLVLGVGELVLEPDEVLRRTQHWIGLGDC